MIFQHLRAVSAALLLSVAFAAPGWAVVDRAICSTADAGATCTGAEIISNANEELTANGNALPLVLGSVAGTDTITATTTPAITSYVDGQLFHLKPAVTNTGAVTLNVSSVAAKAVVSNSGTALGNAELQSGTIYLLRWYASNDHFRVMNMPMITTSMKDELGCAGSQTVRRNAGDTAFECVTISGTGTVTSVATGTGLTGGTITGSGTLSFDYSDAGADPALAADAARFTSNATTPGMMVFEGDTADTFETRVVITDPTADRAFTIPNAASAAIQPLTCGAGDFVSAVSALGALTCTTPAGGSGDSIRIEDGDNAGTFTAAADADFDDAGDINFVNGGGSPASVTAEIRSGAVGTTEAAALDAGDTTTGTFGDARVDGSAEADELVLAGDVDGTANANDIDEANVETELESVLDLADMQGDLALGTKTSGNYVDDVIAGTGIAITHAAGEGSDATVALSFSDAGADPALGADECRFTSNATTGGYIVCEGDTADTIETRIVITDPTASDKTFTLPNGNSVGLSDADKGDITVASSGTDFQIDADAVGANEIAANSVANSELGDDAVGINELDLVDGDTPVNGDCLTYDTGAGGSIEAITCPGAGGGDSIEVEDGNDAGTFTAIGGTAQLDDSGDINFATAADVVTATVRADSVALTTDTTGNYAAGDAEAGAALTGDSASSFFSAGTIELARGGTGASLVDPNADRLFFWDDSAGATDWLTVNAPLAITTTSIDINAATDTTDGSVELATTAEAETGTDTTRAVTAAGVLAAVTGKKPIWLPGGSLTPRTTNGCAVADLELATNDIMLRTCNYDTTTEEGAGFTIRMPDTWNEGTVTFVPVWTHPSTTTNFGVVWSVSCLSTSNDDAMDAALGTPQTSTDTGGTTSDQYTGPESAAITCAGTPQAGDTIYFEIERTPAAGSDTLAVDAYLLGVTVYYTDNAFVEP